MTHAEVTTTAPLLRVRGISKSFFGNEVLSDVDLDLHPGEVVAIVGENGAGKSTLMKTIAGAHQPDRGTIEVDGEEVRFAHPRQAQQLGISIIYQEFNLLLDRTVADNIFLGREPRRGLLVDRRRMREQTAELLETIGVADSISPDSMVRDLSVAQQQEVEIAKALSLDARILIMDEPTASLSPAEAEALFGRVRDLQARGLAVLYISHRMPEIFALSQRVTVLKDGRQVGTVATDEVQPGDLVRMMVGREITHYYPPHAAPEDLGEVRLQVRGGGNAQIHDIDLDLRAGEVVGLAGLEGSGRTELAEALFGITPFTEGTVRVHDEQVAITSPRRAIRLGLGFITEDRKEQGLVLPRSVLENGTLARRSLPTGVRRDRRLEQPAEEAVTALVQQVDLRAADLDMEVRFLSGGNQQKVVLAKWLATAADILIFDEPTRGIDVGAKAGIHELIRELAREGLAVLMISSELPEVIGMSDRILVMRGGTIAAELPADAAEDQIMLRAVGGAADAGDPGTAGAAGTSAPRTDEPPTDEPPTVEPPTVEPPTDESPTDEPPTSPSSTSAEGGHR